jgi:hypothetical protein
VTNPPLAIPKMAPTPMGTAMDQDSDRYEIVVRGALGRAVTRSLGDVEECPSSPGLTCLRVRVHDQAGLRAILAELADLAIELRSLRRIPDDEG